MAKDFLLHPAQTDGVPVHTSMEESALEVTTKRHPHCWICREILTIQIGFRLLRLPGSATERHVYLCDHHYFSTQDRDHPLMMHECHFHHDDEGCVGPRFNNAKACYGGGPHRAGWRWVLLAEYMRGLREMRDKYDSEGFAHFVEQLRGNSKGVIKVDYKGTVLSQ